MCTKIFSISKLCGFLHTFCRWHIQHIAMATSPTSFFFAMLVFVSLCSSLGNKVYGDDCLQGFGLAKADDFSHGTICSESKGARPAGAVRVFTIVNYCKTTVWPGIFPGDNFGGGGFPLKPGESAVITAPFAWSGRIWPRTGCDFDQSGNGSCQTGSCGTSLKCTASGQPPASLAEFTLAAVDFYDVSLVDGFNVPVAVKPINGNGNCSAAGCDEDLLPQCPPELRLMSGKTVVACRSACDVFGTDEYCCRGVHGNPMTCKPTSYSRTFKNACPAAYSYAYDDPSSICTCSGADYIVTFCSNRKQNACSYKDGSLVCSGSGRPISGGWPLAAVLFFSSVAWWVAAA